MVAPALMSITADFDIAKEFLSHLALSIFILTYTFEPLFLEPHSETHGRTVVLQLANLFYLVLNISSGVSQSKGS